MWRVIYIIFSIALLLESSAQSTVSVKEFIWSEFQLDPYEWEVAARIGDVIRVDVEYASNGVSIVDDVLRFLVNPTEPAAPSNAPESSNFRSEIRTSPWQIKHALGTEQWIGWRYQFGCQYQADLTSPIIIFQNHPGEGNLGPQFEIEIASRDRPSPALGGEIQVVCAPNDDRVLYPVVPSASSQLDVVVHIIFGQKETGLLQVWLNDVLYHDVRGATVFDKYPWGGNNKWGIYHHTHRNESDVASTRAQGIEEVEIFMGPLRILTRQPGDTNYGKNAFSEVSPRSTEPFIDCQLVSQQEADFEEFVAFPNPVNNHRFQVMIPSIERHERVIVATYDLKGRELYSVDAIGGKFEVQLPTTHPIGLHLLILKTEQNHLVRKILIQ